MPDLRDRRRLHGPTAALRAVPLVLRLQLAAAVERPTASRRLALALALLPPILSLLLPAEAAAQTASADAETLFRQGKALMRQGKHAEACAAFESSQRAEPAVTTLLNLADCREKSGQLATAWGVFIDVQRQLRAGDAANQQLLRVAAERIAKLEPRLSTLTIEVPAGHRVSGLEVARGGKRVDPGTWGRPLPIDGGTYEIVARAPGRAPWTAKVVIAPERAKEAIEIGALVAARTPERPSGEPRRGASAIRTANDGGLAVRASAGPAEREGGGGDGGGSGRGGARRNKTLAVATLAAGGLAIAGGLTAGSLAMRSWRDAEAACGAPDQCAGADRTARANELAAQARTRAWWSTGLVGGGAIAVAAGVWLLVRPAPRGERAVSIAPQVTGTSLGLAIGGAL